MTNSRIDDLSRFYDLMDALKERLGGCRVLAECHGKMNWPRRGIYFFMEEGEKRTDPGTGPRIVRVGTHALKAGSRTKLWNRLSTHRGTASSGGGNHRGSIFRKLVGTALIKRDGLACATWDDGRSSAPREVRQAEQDMERTVSKAIGAMPFLWLAVDDEPGKGNRRGYIERNAIALLSNFEREPIDAPSKRWLGRHCSRQRVRESGLWNNNHVNEIYDRAFLDELERYIDEVGREG